MKPNWEEAVQIWLEEEAKQPLPPGLTRGPNCPSFADLHRIAASGHTPDDIETHIRQCPFCSRAIDLIRRKQGPIGAGRRFIHGLFERRNRRLPLLAFVSLLVVVLMYFGTPVLRNSMTHPPVATLTPFDNGGGDTGARGPLSTEPSPRAVSVYTTVERDRESPSGYTLRWESDDRATRYHIEIWDDTTSAREHSDFALASAKFYRIPANVIKAGGEYRFRVTALPNPVSSKTITAPKP